VRQCFRSLAAKHNVEHGGIAPNTVDKFERLGNRLRRTHDVKGCRCKNLRYLERNECFVLNDENAPALG
jgi:hypothetical protein